MTRRYFSNVAFAFAVLVLTIPGSLWAAQAAPAAPATLTIVAIVGDGGKSISFAPADLKGLPRTRVEVKTEDGTANIYEGVLVSELLKRAGVPLGAELRGNAVASYVVASASDGYQVVFSLAELDPAFTSNDIIVPSRRPREGRRGRPGRGLRIQEMAPGGQTAAQEAWRSRSVPSRPAMSEARC